MKVATRGILALGLSVVTAAPALATCELTKVSQMELTPLGTHYAVMVKIDGALRPMIVDTGAEVTILRSSAANELHLKPDTSLTHARAVVGIGQTRADVHPNVIPSVLAFGDLVYRDRSTVVGTMGFGAAPEEASIGLVGDDILSQFDVEFDFPARKLTFYRSFGCYGTFLPWNGAYATIPFDHRRAKIVIDATFNRERTPAIVDTGNNVSFIAKDASALWGAYLADIQSTAGRSRSPLNNGESVPVGAYLFDKITIGDVVFSQRKMGVIDVDMGMGSANIGLDYWASRRIWISYGNSWMFVADSPSAVTMAYPVTEGEPTAAGENITGAAGSN